MRIILQWLGVSFGMLGVAYFLPNYLSINPWWVAIISGAAFMFLMTIIKPVISILTLPLTIITLGLFGIVINALLFLALGYLVSGFVINGFVGALVVSAIMSLVYWLVKKIFKD